MDGVLIAGIVVIVIAFLLYVAAVLISTFVEKPNGDTNGYGSFAAMAIGTLFTFAGISLMVSGVIRTVKSRKK